MRMMVISDIHGNLEALDRLLEHAASRNVHRVLCLGDLIGYGPHPNECIERVRALRNCRCVCGNHDTAALWDTSPYGMSLEAREAILWTMDQLTEDNKAYLAALPERLDLADMCFVHANPYNPKGWRYVMDRKYAMRSFGYARFRLCCIGHSHRPLVITRNHFFSATIDPVKGDRNYDISDTKRRIFNCGSVGQPRDRDPRACYLIIDTTRQQIRFHRVAYNVEKTIAAIKAAGLPQRLGHRLKKGL